MLWTNFDFHPTKQNKLRYFVCRNLCRWIERSSSSSTPPFYHFTECSVRLLVTGAVAIFLFLLLVCLFTFLFYYSIFTCAMLGGFHQVWKIYSRCHKWIGARMNELIIISIRVEAQMLCFFFKLGCMRLRTSRSRKVVEVFFSLGARALSKIHKL